MARVGFLSMVNGNEDMINAVRGLSTAFAVKLKNQGHKSIQELLLTVVEKSIQRRGKFGSTHHVKI